MNDKIRQLAEQASHQSPDGYPVTIPYSKDFAKKFAELVVKECARVARATPCPYTDELMIQQLGHTWDMASSAAGREIIQHFGVKK